MKAFSLHQPWASLLVTKESCPLTHLPGEREECGALDYPMVKRFETRSWPCPPKLIGQRVAFHSAKREPRDWGRPGHGDYWVEYTFDGLPRLVNGKGVDVPLPLGCIVGSGVITASLPIVQFHTRPGDRLACPEWTPWDGSGTYPARRVAVNWDASTLTFHAEHGARPIDISDQLPYGDWTPGRYAWQIEDAAPCTERCPWCWGEGARPRHAYSPCGVCGETGHCEPIPAVGQQGFWRWER